MRKLKLLCIIWTVLMCYQAQAQQNIVYSQYLFNGLLINPAYAGSHVQWSSTLTYRNQWVNFEGSPRTTTFGTHSSFLKGKIGVGLLLTNDQIGSYKNNGAFASFAYIIKDPLGGTFSFGVQAGVNNFKGDFGDLLTRDGADNLFSRALNDWKPNFGGGVFYYNKKFFAGFSVPTILTQGLFTSSGLAQLKTPRFYYLNGGMKIALDPRTERVIMQPSILIRAQDGTPLSADYTVNIVFDQLIGIGSSYRSGDGAVLFINYKLSEKFYVSYSYDYTTSDIRRYSNGTHEIMLNFRTRIPMAHQNLDCPHVYSH